MRPITFIVLFFLFFCCSLHAQQREPSSFDFSTSASVISTNAGVNIIARGWNWGSVHREVSEAMKVEFEHGGNITDNKPTGMNLIVPPAGLGGNKDDNVVIQGLAMHYNPAATTEEVAATNATGRYTLPLSGDNTGAAFGFLYRARGTIATIDGSPRFRLLTTDVSTTTGTLVLDKPWPNDELRRFDRLNPRSTTASLLPEKSGDRWYLSINLRPLNPADGVGDDEVILKIRIPALVDLYSTTAMAQHVIVFEPSNNPAIATLANVHTVLYDNRSSTPSSANFRGRAYYWTPPGGESTTFFITRKMLSRSSHPDSLDMTVSAFFTLNRLNIFASNPYDLGQTSKNSNDYNAIMQTGIEVEYCGKSPIAISWIRFETEYGQEYFRGKYDAEIRNNLQTLLNDFKNPLKNPSGCKLFRFYGLDEAPPMQFWAMRYFNRVTGGLALTELGTDYAPHYRHIVQPAEYWTGGAIAGDAQSSAPYIAYGASDYDDAPSTLKPRRLLMLGFGSGYIGDKRSNKITYRHYDMRVKGDNIHLDGSSFPTYIETMADSKGSASKMTGTSMAAYIWSLERNYPHNLIFSPTPWWSQIWQYSNWALSSYSVTSGTVDQTAMLNGTRPQTGEELRATMWLPILLGAKGVMYYQELTSKIGISTQAQYDQTAFIGLTSGNNSVAGVTGASIVTSNTLLGGDFIECSTTAIPGVDGWVDWSDVRDLSEIDRWIPHISTRATALGVPAKRLYLGRESGRKVVYEFNRWLDDTETELTTLRLKGWLCKHFRTTVTTASLADLTAFSERVLLTSTATQTRQIGRIDGYEAPDSSIVHITYLEPQTNPDNRFYIGILNGKLDPVVVVPTTATFTINGVTVTGTSYGHPTAATLTTIAAGKEFRFFSTAEFDALSTTATPVPAGKLGMYSQLGAREIAIRFNYKTTDEEYQLLRVQQVGGGLDTVVGEDSRLPVLYKPGEGKMFRVTPLPVNTKPTGELAYSNQRKIVVFPKQGSANQFYYHMVYERTKLGRTSVYYRRSKVVTSATISENINWESETVLRGTTATGSDCMHPALVVRNNSAGVPTVYAVYGCTGATTPAGSIAIVENMFPAEAAIMTSTTGTVIGTISGVTSLTDWGTPAISAIASGNFYCWPTTSPGIVVGYRATTATTQSLTSLGSVRWAATSNTCQHPSMNTYSRVASGEKESALVWQEDGQVYYALPYLDGSSSIRFRDLAFITTISPQLNASRNAMRLSDNACTSFNRFPVVYRAIETGNANNDGKSRTIDRVFWETYSNNFSPRYRLGHARVDFIVQFGSSPVSGGTVSRSHSILAYNKRVGQPDLAQGVINYAVTPGIGSLNKSDSAYVLNCVTSPAAPDHQANI